MEALAALCCGAAVASAAWLVGAKRLPRAADLGSRLLRIEALAAWRRWLEANAVRAGEERREAARVAGRQILCGAAGCAAGVVFLAGGLSPALAVALPLLGAALPALALRDGAKRRQVAIGRALPWTLDLFGLAVEVGADFNVALVRVVEQGRGGPLEEELARVLKELRIGSSRQEALEALAARTGHPAVARFCTAVIQAERLGTPLRRVLRDQADDLRVARCQRAEQLAGEAPVKLLMPLLGCVFPCVFLVLLGPIAFAILFGGGVP